MINRDIINWQPFDSLVSSQKMINSIVNEKAKINKPILSSDQLNQLNDLIIEYFYEQINIIIKYYKNNNIYKTAGIIIDLNQSNKTITLNTNVKLHISQILQIST